MFDHLHTATLCYANLSSPDSLGGPERGGCRFHNIQTLKASQQVDPTIYSIYKNVQAGDKSSWTSSREKQKNCFFFFLTFFSFLDKTMNGQKTAQLSLAFFF